MNRSFKGTSKYGVQTVERDEFTGALPGKLLRV